MFSLRHLFHACAACGTVPILEHGWAKTFKRLLVVTGIIDTEQMRTASEIISGPGQELVDVLLNLRFTDECRLSDLCWAVLPSELAAGLAERRLLLPQTLRGSVIAVLHGRHEQPAEDEASKELTLRMMAARLRMELVNLDALEIPLDLIRKVPAEIATRYGVVPFKHENGILTLAMAAPDDPLVLVGLRHALKGEVRGAVASPGQVKRAMAKYYGSVSGA